MSLILTACGGGGGSTDAPSAVAPTTITITAQPADQSVTRAGTAHFALTASGDGLNYRWQLSTDAGQTWTDVSGATSDTLDLSGVTSAQDGYQYRAVLTGNGGATATSVAVTLKVAATAVAPSITADVQSVSVVEGQSATLSVTAAGSNLVYVWQFSNDGSTWADVASATSANLMLSALPASADGRSYRVVVSNSAGTVTSGTASLRVQATAGGPSFTSQASSVSVVAPAAATFTVAVSGTPAPSLQWQQSTDAGVSYTDIPGATGASYTTAATAVSGTGTRYRVVAINSAGSSVSNAVVLTVAAAAAVPSLTAQPASLTVTAGQIAKFSATASGTPTPSYQWQLSTDGGATWTNVNGATATSYTTGTLAVTDSGRQYRVQVINSNGSVRSGVAILTVNAVASPLSNRTWTGGQQLETNDNPVASYGAGIDDQGNTVVVFSKSDGTRLALYATRGKPNGPGIAPTFTSPVVVDGAAPAIDNGGLQYSVAVAPNGKAVVAWGRREACGATDIQSFSTCRFVYTAELDPSTGNWSAPTRVANVPSYAVRDLSITSSGHIQVGVSGWDRTISGNPERFAVTWKAAGASGYQQALLPNADVQSSAPNVHLSEAGNLVVIQQAYQNATKEIAAYRGNVTTGLGAQEVIDTRGAAATLQSSHSGSNGQVVVLWEQNNGTISTKWAATLDAAASSWQVQDLAIPQPQYFSSPIKATVTDGGDFVWYSMGRCAVMRRTSGVWSAEQALPKEICGVYIYAPAISRSGHLLLTDKYGHWATYDGVGRAVIKAPDAFILGVQNDLGGGTLLSESGLGGFIAIEKYDVLPSVAVPSGDARTISNLWGFYMK